MTTTSREWYEGPFLKRSDWKSTINTPNYRSLVASKQALPDNPFSHYGEWQYIDDLRGTVSYWNGTRFVESGSYAYRPIPMGFVLPRFSWEFPNKEFLEKVKKDSIGIITMFAERKQTASLLKEFVGNTLYTLVHWKKPIKVLRRWLKDDVVTRKWATKRLHRRIARCTTPADAWLEYRFAYRPLYHDVVDSLYAFENSVKKQHIVRVTKKGGSTGTTTADGLGPIGNVRGTCSSVYRYRMGARFRVVDPSLAALGNLASVGAGLWDILVLSFVIDWAWDISSYLDLQNATLGLEFVSGFRSLKRVHERTYAQYPVDAYGGLRYTPTGVYEASWRSESFDRTKMDSCPTPTITAGTAAEIFETTHIIDMLAIIRSIWMGTYRNTYHFTD